MIDIDLNMIGALAGLAGAVSNNGRLSSTDQLVATALQAAGNSDDSTKAAELTKEIQSEKYRLAPGCACCQNRCGNTSDYSAGLFLVEPADIKALKLQMIQQAIKLADTILAASTDPTSIELPDAVYRALLCWSCQLDAADYLEVIRECTDLMPDLSPATSTVQP